LMHVPVMIGTPYSVTYLHNIHGYISWATHIKLCYECQMTQAVTLVTYEC
jgi:hypothetical protein